MSKKVLLCSAVAGILLLGLSGLAFAAELEAEVMKRGLTYFVVAVATAGFGIAIASFGGAWGQSWATKSGLEGIARNPEASGKITVALIIALALIESLVIYTLVVALIILFANPMTSPIMKLLGME